LRPHAYPFRLVRRRGSDPSRPLTPGGKRILIDSRGDRFEPRFVG